MKTFKYIIIGLVGTLMVMASCTKDGSNETSPMVKTQEFIDKTQAVEVVKPTERTFVAEVLISGTAQANQKTILYAMVSGYVKKIYVDLGHYVKKGQIIANLENPEILGQLEEKQALLNAKKTTYERLKSIHEKTPALTPIQMVENAEAAYIGLKASITTIQKRLSYLQVKAPFSGIITNRLVDNGALVQSGLTEGNPQGIVEIQDINPIRLSLPLPESDVASVGRGMEAFVDFPELPGASYKVKVSRTAGALDPASKTMRVEIDINNKKGLIKPGMYAKVKMQISNRKGVLSLPVTAQWMYENAPFVLVVKDSIVERIPLRKGLSNKDYFEVLNPEITAESLVIIQGKGLVKPGQIVKAVYKGQ